MGNPIFRFRFIHEESNQTLEFSEPDGWLDAKLTLSRDLEFHSLIEKFDSPFIFYGNNGTENGGAEFLRAIRRQYGFDTELVVDIDLAPDGVNWQDIFTGLYDFTMDEETNRNKIKSAIIRNDFWTKFISRRATPVDLMSTTDLDENAINVPDPVDVRLTPQKLRMEFSGETINFGNDASVGLSLNIPDGHYLQINWGNIILDEIDDRFNLPVEQNPALPAWTFEVEYGGVYTFDIFIAASIELRSGGVVFETFSVKSQNSVNWPEASTDFCNFYVQINDTPHVFSWSEVFDTFDPTRPIGTDFTFNQSFTLNKGDRIYIYGWMENEYSPTPFVPGDFLFFRWNDFAVEGGTIDGRPSYANITADTVFPESTADGFFLHDAGAAICDRITGKNDSFYSQTLGSSSTSRIYPGDGCYWENIIAKGLQLRNYTLQEKPFFLSFNDWWEGANPIFNLGLGYNVVNGAEVIEVAAKEEFYDDSGSASVYFDDVYDIVRKYDNDVIFNKVEVGYQKWESENLSGIDDPQTKHTYATRLKKSGKAITIESGFIAASLAIETTRRQSEKKSKDYKLDNDTFIISVNAPEVSPDVYLPKLIEDYSSVTNLLNSETRYNIGLSPARNLIRWKNYLQGCLQYYLDSTFKFTSGQGNYDMVSDLISSSCDGYTDPLSEKQNIPVTTDYLHLPDLYEANVSITWEQYSAIRNNRKKWIGISQTTRNHVKCFIKELTYEICKSRAKIVFWTKTELQITNTNFVKPVETCYPIPSTSSCENAYETETGEDFTTETGECLELE